MLRKSEKTQFFFFYFSGHGMIKNGEMIGIDKNGGEIEIEKKLR